MIKKIIGGGLIATPFVALFIFLVIQASLLVAVIIYGMVCVVFGLITAGVMLIWGDEPISFEEDSVE
tara:strand:+ start:580 stop:780 length:201 start_codon:yes stop_codon:yes gene_type:complete